MQRKFFIGVVFRTADRTTYWEDLEPEVFQVARTDKRRVLPEEDEEFYDELQEVEESGDYAVEELKFEESNSPLLGARRDFLPSGR